MIANVQTNHSDYYSVVVSNALGATTSNPSRLFVDPSVVLMATNNYWSGVNCANNLNQIALFGLMLANDRNDRLPQSLSEMTNSYGQPIFGWPVILYLVLNAYPSTNRSFSFFDDSPVSQRFYRIRTE